MKASFFFNDDDVAQACAERVDDARFERVDHSQLQDLDTAVGEGGVGDANV